MIGSFESLQDFRIHFNGHILILDGLLGPSLNLALHPLLESFTNNCVNDVGNVGSWQLLDLSRLNWKRLHHLCRLSCMVKHCIQSQAFEMRHVNCLHSVSLDDLPLAACQVSIVEDSDIVIGWQVRTDVEAQELIHFSL